MTVALLQQVDAVLPLSLVEHEPDLMRRIGGFVERYAVGPASLPADAGEVQPIIDDLKFDRLGNFNDSVTRFWHCAALPTGWDSTPVGFSDINAGVGK